MKRYDVIIGGNRTTLLLSDADAAARGLVVAEEPATQPEPAKVATKAKTPANKGRKPSNKRAEAVEAAFTPTGATE